MRIAARWLDFEHIRAKIREHHGGEAGDRTFAEIDDPEAGEGSAHVSTRRQLERDA